MIDSLNTTLVQICNCHTDTNSQIADTHTHTSKYSGLWLKARLELVNEWLNNEPASLNNQNPYMLFIFVKLHKTFTLERTMN